MYKMSDNALREAQQAVLDDRKTAVTTMDADMNFEFDETVGLARFLVQMSKPMDSYIKLMVKTFDLGFDDDQHVSEDLEGVLLLEAYQNMEVTLEEDEDLWPEYLWPAALPAADPAVEPAPAPPLSMTVVPVRASINNHRNIVSEPGCSSSGGPPVPTVIQLASSRLNDFIYAFVFSFSH